MVTITITTPCDIVIVLLTIRGWILWRWQYNTQGGEKWHRLCCCLVADKYPRVNLRREFVTYYHQISLHEPASTFLPTCMVSNLFPTNFLRKTNNSTNMVLSTTLNNMMRHILAVLDDSDSFVHNDGGDDENLVTRRQIFDLNLNKTITITMTIAIATKPRQQMEDLSS